MIEKRLVQWYAADASVDLDIAEREIVLAYVLCILSESDLLNRMAFKGGTAIRKLYLGGTGRFSLDLDFTAMDVSDPDDLILTVAEVFDDRVCYGITFSVQAEDFYVREDRQACGARVGYAHEWNPLAQFALDVSLREKPVLGVQTRPLLSDSYFKHLEIEPPVVTTLRFEEIVAEKIRATYQRLTVRDVYDLYQFRQSPFDRDLVRTLTVLKLWLVGDTFNPDRFFTRLESGQYDWSDLARLVRRSRRPESETVVTGCLDSYGFLQNLSPDESELVGDPHWRRRDLYERIVQGLRP